MSDMIVMRFVAANAPYQTGETAGFGPDRARELYRAGKAVPHTEEGEAALGMNATEPGSKAGSDSGGEPDPAQLLEGKAGDVVAYIKGMANPTQAGLYALRQQEADTHGRKTVIDAIDARIEEDTSVEGTVLDGEADEVSELIRGGEMEAAELQDLRRREAANDSRQAVLDAIDEQLG